MVHRAIAAMLDGTLEKSRGRMAAAADRAAKQSSDREVHAMTAERDIDKCYMAQFMSAHVGETFTGTVSGVAKFGLFVALPNGVEGLLPVTALPDDRYEYDEVRMTLTGPRTKFTYTFGMPIQVLCAAADPGSGQIDFLLPGAALPAAGEKVQPPKPARTKPRDRDKAPRQSGGKPSYRPPRRTKGRRRR